MRLLGYKGEARGERRKVKGEGQKEDIFLKKIHFFITTLVHFNNFYYLCNVLARLAKIIPIFSDFLHRFYYMQYDMQKLGRMTLEQLKEIAASFGLKVGRNASLQSIIYDILDAQADKRGAEVQAKEDAKQAKNEEKKRGKRQRIQNTPTKVNTDNLKSNRMIATVGNEQETLGQIKEEQAKQPTPKPVVSAQQANIFSLEAKGVVSDQGDKAKGEEVKAKKKRGRPKKEVKSLEDAALQDGSKTAYSLEAKGVVSDQGDKAKGEENPNTPKKSAETSEEKKAAVSHNSLGILHGR